MFSGQFFKAIPNFTIFEKLGYLHVYCPGITRIEDKLFLAGDHGVPDDEVLLPPGDDV